MLIGVLIAAEAARLVPARASIGVDARHADDAAGTGIEAVRRLQAGGMGCHVTLVLSTAQAHAEAGAFPTSPFVGRITDWQHERAGAGATSAVEPGVAFVAEALHALRAREPDSRDGGLAPQASSRSSRSPAATGSPSRPTSRRSWRGARGPSRRRSRRRRDPRDPGARDHGDGVRGRRLPATRWRAGRSRPASRASRRAWSGWTPRSRPLCVRMAAKVGDEFRPCRHKGGMAVQLHRGTARGPT